MTYDEDDLLAFLYACPVGLAEMDRSGTISLANPHAMKHLLPLAGPEGVSNFFAATENHAPELRNLSEAFDKDQGTICEGHRIFVDLDARGGNLDPKVLSCSLVKLGPDRLIATLSDVSAQVAKELRLRQADTWFSGLLDEINDHVLLTIDRDGLILSTTPSFARQTGHVSADVIGVHADTILRDVTGEPADATSIADQLFLAERDGWNLLESWNSRANGERYWCQRLLVAREQQTGSEHPVFSVVLRDVPAHDDNASHLVMLLTRDHLTGASNRMHFQKTLRHERSRSRRMSLPLSLVLFDLDHFKAINDTYGHPLGDSILREIGRIGSMIVPRGAVFARIGGEEFAMLLPGHTASEALRLAEAARIAIENSGIETGDTVVRVTASFGLAEISETDGSSDQLIGLADKRLYEAKKGGRNRVSSEAA